MNELEKIIHSNPDELWDWESLSWNPNITFDMVCKYPQKPWDWFHLSTNPNITIELVEQHPDQPWDWNGLSLNPNVTYDIVERHSDKPWDWGGLSQNPNMTLDIVEKHPDHSWDWNQLSYNKFKKHPFFENRLPRMTKEKRCVLNELEQMFDVPPNCDSCPVFAKGGALYWEEWNKVQVFNDRSR